MDVVYDNGSYRITYNGVAMIENALGNPNLIQISVSSACTVTPNPVSYDLAYLPNGEYRTWSLTGVNTKLNAVGAHNIYLRLSREGDSALIVFSQKEYEFSGKIADLASSTESAEYYYIKAGTITETDSLTSPTVQRHITMDFGYFTSAKDRYETEGNDLFELIKTSSPWLIKPKYWLSSFSVQGFITLMGGLIFSNGSYEKKITNVRTTLDTDETCPISDETIPTTKWVISVTEDKFLRKDRDDQTKYLLSLLGGAIIKKWLKIGDFITGITGGYIDEIGNAELESLVLRDHLSVPEIRYNRMTYFEGYNLISPGGGFTVMEVTDNGDGSYTIVPELEEGEPIGQYVDDILLGYWHEKNATGDFAGFQKVQFRVTEVDYDAKWCKLSPRPGTNAVPLRNMRLGQTGNFTNTQRQTYIIIDTRDGNNCITFMDDANTWDPEPAQMKSWFGKKKGMNVQGIDCDNYSAVLQNILCVGNYFQVDQITGDKVRVPCDKGAWAPGEYAYYDRVTHNGCLWLCVNDKGVTTSEPADDNPDWLKQVDRGAGVQSSGEWTSTTEVYETGTIVSLGDSFYVSKKDTSEPPIALYKLDDGTYAMTEDGKYILMGDWETAGNKEDWELLVKVKDGTSILFQGAFPVAPENPQEGWCYYNTTDRCSYVFRDGEWRVMVRDGKDGTDYEWIYQRTQTEEDKPAQPMSDNVDDYVPPGWTDDPTGVSKEWPYEWACKRIKTDGVWGDFSPVALCYKFGEDGESNIFADIDNEMDSVALEDNGTALDYTTLYTAVSMWYGTTRLSLLEISCDMPDGMTETHDLTTGIITFVIPKGTALNHQNNVIITVTALIEGIQESRELNFTIAGVKGGENAVLYRLVPSVSSVSLSKEGDYSVASISCTRQKSIGKGDPAETTDGELKYSIDGGAETAVANNAPVSTALISTSIRFKFYVSGEVVDVETILVVKDGKDGAGVSAAGEWTPANVPYLKGSFVLFAGCTYLAKEDTSEPPIAIWKSDDDTYILCDNGDFALIGGWEDAGNTDYWQQVAVGQSGESAVYADLDNEMDGLALDADGKAMTETSMTTNVSMWYGTQKMPLTALSVILPAGVSETHSVGTGAVTFKVAKGTALAERSTAFITVTGAYNGTGYTRELVFTIAGVKGGKDAVLYRLVPSVSAVYKDNDDNYSVSSVSCTRQKSSGSGDPAETTDGELKYSIDGGAETAVANNAPISVNSFTSCIQFKFYVNGEVVDVETIPILKDGADMEGAGDWSAALVPYKKGSIVMFGGSSYLAKRDTSDPPIAIWKREATVYALTSSGCYALMGSYDTHGNKDDWQLVAMSGETGDSPLYADLDNEMDGVALTSEGKTLRQTTITTHVSVWYGTERLSITGIACTLPAGVTETHILSSGAIIFAVAKDVDFPDRKEVVITVKAVYNGMEYSKNVVFTILGVKGGESAVFYRLLPSVSAVTKDKNGAYSVAYVSCTRTRTIGNGTPTETLIGELKYSLDGASEIATQNNTQIATNKFNKSIRFSYYVEGQLVDIETVPMIMEGNDGESYWLDCPVSVITFSMTGFPSPSSFLVTCKASIKNVVSNYDQLYLVARKYKDGEGWTAHVAAVKSATISVTATAGYSQFAVRAYKTLADANAWSDNYLAEKGVGVAKDGDAGNWTSNVFKKSDTQPATPTGTNPIPAGWLDAPNTADGKWWMSKAVINGVTGQAGPWSTPQQVTAIDGAGPRFKFAVNSSDITPPSLVNNVRNPSGWYDVPQTVNEGQYLWMTTAIINADNTLSGAWSTPVRISGEKGAAGQTGAFPRDRGKWTSGSSYVWNADYRDHIIRDFNGVYYNFLVKNYGSTVTAAPTSANGDNNWLAMNQYESIATDTLFADGANVANFMFKDGILRSQQETGGTPNCLLNGKTGYFFCNNVEVTGTIHATNGEFSGELKSPVGNIGGFALSSDRMVATGTVSYNTSLQTLSMELNYKGIKFTSNGMYASSVVIGSTYLNINGQTNRYAINVNTIGIGAYGINIDVVREDGIAMNIENGIVMGLREYFYKVSTIRTSSNPYELANISGTVFVSASSATHLKLPTSPKDGTTICVRKTGNGNITMHGKMIKPDQWNERPTAETTVSLQNGSLFIFKYSAALEVWTANYMN